MKWLGPLLLVGVFLRNNTSQWLPSWYSPGAWFYMLGGLWEAALCAILLTFLRSPLAVCALWIGIAEGAQVTVCRVLTKDITKVQGNLCDALIGWPIGPYIMAMYLIAAGIVIAFEWKRL